MVREDSITVMIKSYIPPDEPLGDFHLGEYFKMNLPGRITLGELTRKIFSKNVDQIGMITVNGRIASEKTVLSPGDQIDLYPLLEGG